MTLSRILVSLLLLLVLPAWGQSRVFQTTPRTWYVDNVNGVDGNGCSQIAPCKTVQFTINCLVDGFDFAAQPTIQLVTTGVAYAEALVLPRYVGSLGYRAQNPDTYTYFTIQGDLGNNSAVVIHPATGSAVTAVHSSPFILASLTVASNDGVGLNVDAGSHILGHNLNFGQVGSGACQILAQHDGWYEHLKGPFTISGGGFCHAYAHFGGRIYAQSNNTAAIPFGPYFDWFVIADAMSIIDYSAVSYTGCLQGCATRPVSTSSGGMLFPAPGPAWP